MQHWFLSLLYITPGSSQPKMNLTSGDSAVSAHLKMGTSKQHHDGLGKRGDSPISM